MRALPEFSVVIPTYGPAPFLSSVLSALNSQQHRDFEVIVVDNNPTPKAKAGLECKTRQSLRLIHDEQLGLSRARNVGVDHARGEYVAFLDDDAIPDPEWLFELAIGIPKYQATVAGGCVQLQMPNQVPRWFDPAVRPMLSELVYSGRDIPEISLSQYIVGANMCIARKAFEKAGGFRVGFGRVGRVLRSHEEVEFCRRLQRFGYRISFLARACVHHQIPAVRLRRSFLLRRAYWQGRSDVLLEMAHGRPMLFGERNNIKNLKCLGRSVVDAVQTCPRRTGFTSSLQLAREFGYLVEFAKASAAGARMYSAEYLMKTDAHPANRSH